MKSKSRPNWIPHWRRGWISVWHRNFLQFKRSFLVSVFWAGLEPILYLLAVGYGLGGFIGSIGPAGSGRYVDFFFPALLTTTAMNLSFFETTYASFSRMTHQKVFTGMLLTQLNADEVALGEIFWGASKGMFSVFFVLLVSLFFGLIKSWDLVFAIAYLGVACVFFSALGLIVTSYARNYDSFIYVISGAIVPMSLFSATYFPVGRFPEMIRWTCYLSPLTHFVIPVRRLTEGAALDGFHWVQIVGMTLLTLLTAIFASHRLRQRLSY